MKWVSLTLLVGLAFALSACQAAQPRRPTVEGRFDIGGTSLYLLCFDARPGPDATPTVLLEHGIGRRATSEMWVAVNIKWRPLPACVAMIVPVSGRVSSGPHHQDSGEAKIRESTAGVSRKPSSDCKACGCSSKHLCGLTAWNT